MSVNDPSDDRSPMAVAMVWSSRITTIAMEMVLPALLGIWADRRLGTGILFLLLGVVFGFILGMWSLLKLAKTPSRDVDLRQKDQENASKR
ncbi:MAG TPA: AtpZ/AtpI family protein [Thermoguttaceae bacterium]|nr:AtpZ/AtpI family protein [Thermoguttaceae bacterium]